MTEIQVLQQGRGGGDINRANTAAAAAATSADTATASGDHTSAAL